MKKKIPIKRALTWIFLWTLLISGSAAFGLLYYLHVKAERFNDTKYTVASISQCCYEGSPLPTGYFAELLGLSQDRAVNLYRLNHHEAINELLKSHIIKTVDIKKIPPTILWIGYKTREPIATLGELTNTAFDEEGVLFPYLPMLPNLKVPKVYLGVDARKVSWGDQMKSDETALALEILKVFDEKFQGELLQLDVSRAYSKSHGLRSITAALSKGGHIHLLRLSEDGFSKQIANYQTLNQYFISAADTKTKVLDFRLPSLAYIANIQTKEN